MAGNYGQFNRREKYVLSSGALAAFNFSASTGKLGDDMYFAEPAEISGMFVQVVTALVAQATLVDLVITLEVGGTAEKLVGPEGKSSQLVGGYEVPLSTLGNVTITIPATVTPGLAVGKVYRCLFNPIIVLPGQLIQMVVTTQAAASPSGTYLAGVLYDFHPEIGANCPNIVDVTK